jgi:hypothetical protein
MEFDGVYKKYEALLVSLKSIIVKSQGRILSDEYDDIFSENVNFFVKSYLITICTYLEAYLQDVAFEHTYRVSQRLKAANIPHNFLYWKLSKDIKDKELSFENASYSCTKKDISDIISGNPYKTIKAFQLIGVNLGENDGFNQRKPLINSMVTKRNSIIHHNDDAGDISFNDLVNNIDIVLSYMKSIDIILSDDIQK